MGNNSSKDGGELSAPNSQASSPVVERRKTVKKVTSLQGQFAQPTAAAPTTTLESATGTTGKSAGSGRSSISQGRGRSSTQGSTSQAAPTKDASYQSSPATEKAQKLSVAKSNEDRSVSPSQKALPILSKITTTTSQSERAPSETSTVRASAPQDIPSATPHDIPSPDPYYLPTAQYTRAPRLPIPVEEEEQDPGSPIPVPADAGQGAEYDEDAAAETKSITALSHVSDADDVSADDVFGLGMMHGLPRVPTLIEWKEGGDTVYVTGSWSNWEVKLKLFWNGPSPDPRARSRVIDLPPGTHHISFLVDGVLRPSSFMPTTVEIAIQLVNYIQVPNIDPATLTKPLVATDLAQPLLVQDAGKDPQRFQPTFPPTPELRPTTTVAASNMPSRTASQKHRPSSQPHSSSTPGPTRPTPLKKKVNTAKYTNEIPMYLQHLDAPEGSSRYARASAVMDSQPQPPSLPMFLSKSVLNSATPMKDDASVLVLPNHTVLNHLATSSIKSGVLATSATTRYKNKYVTTILYKPTGSDD